MTYTWTVPVDRQDTAGLTEFEDDETNHIVCCEDKHLALCGEDVSEGEWADESEGIPCGPCGIADVQNICPKGKICVNWLDDNSHN